VDVFKIEVFKVALFILPGIITLRIKAALSISAPSKPLNTMIDGLAFTLIDHALFGISKATLDAFSHYPVVSGINRLAQQSLQHRAFQASWGKHSRTRAAS